MMMSQMLKQDYAFSSAVVRQEEECDSFCYICLGPPFSSQRLWQSHDISCLYHPYQEYVYWVFSIIHRYWMMSSLFLFMLIILIIILSQKSFRCWFWRSFCVRKEKGKQKEIHYRIDSLFWMYIILVIKLMCVYPFSILFVTEGLPQTWKEGRRHSTTLCPNTRLLEKVTTSSQLWIC